MITPPANPAPPVEPSSYRRGDIWMVDFGNPVGTELGMEHPAVIVSIQELNKAPIRRVIIVPGTSTRITNAQGQTIRVHHEVPVAPSNGLHHTTYFMSEQVRTASLIRFRRLVGAMEQGHVREIEDRLCLVMGLFR